MNIFDDNNDITDHKFSDTGDVIEYLGLDLVNMNHTHKNMIANTVWTLVSKLRKYKEAMDEAVTTLDGRWDEEDEGEDHVVKVLQDAMKGC
jgi:hypothetical protein